MSPDEVQKSISRVKRVITKPRSSRNPPAIGRVRAALRTCLEKNDFKLVLPFATYFAKRLLPLDYTSLKLLAECFEKMGDKAKAEQCRSKAEAIAHVAGNVHQAAKDNTLARPSGTVKLARTSLLSPPRTKADVKETVDMEVDEEEEGEVEEPPDPVDYAEKLDEVIMRPSLSEEVLLPRKGRVLYEHSENRAQKEMTVKLRLKLEPSRCKDIFEDSLIAQGLAPMTRKDTRGGDRAFRNARSRAAKEAMDKLADMCKRLEDEARRKLRRTLNALFNDWRRDAYVDKCYQGFKRARDIIFGSAHGGLYSARVFLYGSATTGLVLGDSDIDVAIDLPLPKSVDDPRYKHAEILYFLRDVMKKKMHDVEVIAKAKVPVLRYYDEEAKIDVDVTLATDKSVLLSRLLRRHLKHDARVWELSMAVKYWARRRRISGTPQGHINPIGWTVMVIYFLQHHVTPRIGALFKTKGTNSAQAVVTKIPWAIPKGSGESTVETGELLLLFFKFFGYKFDFAESAISLNMQYPEGIQALTGKKHGGAIFIEQPLEHGVNVVDYVNAQKLDIVKSELRRAYVECKTSGAGSSLFRTRQKDQEDYLFGR